MTGDKVDTRVHCPSCDTSYPFVALKLPDDITEATVVCATCKHQFEVSYYLLNGITVFGIKVTKDKLVVNAISRSCQPKPGEDAL